MRWIRATAAVAVAAGLAVGQAAAQHGAPADGEWRSYAGDSGSTKYSPLDQITADNFADLEARWHWRSADTHLVHSTPAGDSLVAADTLFGILQAEEPDLWTGWDGVRQTRTRPSIRALVATPLMVDGVLYVSTPLYQAAAIDARSGETLWVHDPRAYESGMPAIAQWRHRGVAYWENAGDAPHRVGHRRRLPPRGRREDRHPRSRLRRGRARRSHRRRAAGTPRRARHPEPAAAFVAVTAPRHPRHHHRRLDHQRSDHHPRGDARLRPRLRHAGPAATGGTSTPCPRARTSSGRTRGWTSRGATAATRTSGR